MVAPPGSPLATLPVQVIECVNRLVRVVPLAPAMVAIAEPAPPDVAEIDSVAPFAESVTVT